MSQGHFQTESGAYVVIDNVFVDAVGVENLLDNYFLDIAGDNQQIFFDAGIPLWPTSLNGHPRLYEALDMRVFEAIDTRVFEV